MKKNDLQDFVHNLVEPTKIAASDLEHLSLAELEALITLPDMEKVAYLAKCVDDDRYGSWLDQFAGTPLHAKAVQLCEQEIELEKAELEKRLQRRQESAGEEEIWSRRDMLRLQKDILMLELHKSTMGQGGGKDPSMQPQAAAAEEVVEPTAAPKGKTAADIQTVGQINNGDPTNPDWPRSTLGVDAAGRRATPEEETEQKQTGLAASPTATDASFHNPEHGDKSAGELLKEAVSHKFIADHASSGAVKRLLNKKLHGVGDVDHAIHHLTNVPGAKKKMVEKLRESADFAATHKGPDAAPRAHRERSRHLAEFASVTGVLKHKHAGDLSLLDAVKEGHHRPF